MRETLGLNGRGRSQPRLATATSPKQRHRFVLDGEVPVTHLTGTRDGDTAAATRGKLAALEASLEAEQAARAKAEQAAQASMAQMHLIETKLAHVEMAAGEALEAERRMREQAESQLQAALAERDVAREALAAQPAPKPVVRKERVKAEPRTPKLKEQKPVKWWLGKSPLKASTH